MNKFNIKYKIIETYEDTKSITVRYWTDNISEEELRVSAENLPDGSPARCKNDIHIELDLTIKTEEDLHNRIISCAPIQTFKRAEEFKNSTDLNPVLLATNLIHKTHEKEIEEPDPEKYESNSMINSPKELTDEEIEKLLEEITTKSSQ